MSITYTCTVSLQGTGISISWQPAKPPEGFLVDDIVHLTSNDGARWKIGFKSSPFADDPDGAVRSFQGAKGAFDGGTLGKTGVFPFVCGIFDGTKWVGWGPDGDQFPVKNKTPGT